MTEAIWGAPVAYWVWVFGEIEGLRWVLQHVTMAFPEHAGARLARMGAGDLAILYVTRGAFHNPSRDVARLAGVIEVLDDGVAQKRINIAGREFLYQVGIRPLSVLEERQGPPVKELVSQLEVVKRPEVWGQYFRSSPIEITEGDFGVLRAAVESFVSNPSG